MNIADLFPLQRILIDEVYQSRKRVLEVLAGLLADDQLGGQESTRIYEILIERERLGCTAIGKGIAIPHGRDAATLRPRGAVIRLTEGIIGLIVPTECPENHLAILGVLAEHLSNEDDLEAMMQAQSPERIRSLLIEWLNPLALPDE